MVLNRGLSQSYICSLVINEGPLLQDPYFYGRIAQKSIKYEPQDNFYLEKLIELPIKNIFK